MYISHQVRLLYNSKYLFTWSMGTPVGSFLNLELQNRLKLVTPHLTSYLSYVFLGHDFLRFVVHTSVMSFSLTRTEEDIATTLKHYWGPFLFSVMVNKTSWTSWWMVPWFAHLPCLSWSARWFSWWPRLQDLGVFNDPPRYFQLWCCVLLGKGQESKQTDKEGGHR